MSVQRGKAEFDSPGLDRGHEHIQLETEMATYEENFDEFLELSRQWQELVRAWDMDGQPEEGAIADEMDAHLKRIDDAVVRVHNTRR